MVEKSEDLHRLSDKAKTEIVELRAELNRLNSIKEGFWKQMQKLRTEIGLLLTDAKNFKAHRNELTTKVKLSKKKREELNKKIRVLVERLKKAIADEQAAMRDSDVKVSPARIKKEIEQLERKIETEVLPFSKEKALMKEIRLKKTQIKGSEKFFELRKETRRIKKDLDKLRREARSEHTSVQKAAGCSQEEHEQLMGRMKAIDDLRKAEKKATTEYLAIKEQMAPLLEELNKKLSLLGKTAEKIGRSKKLVYEKKKSEAIKELKKKKVDVEAKFKKGGKLTTEDLLLYQSSVDDKD